MCNFGFFWLDRSVSQRTCLCVAGVFEAVVINNNLAVKGRGPRAFGEMLVR